MSESARHPSPADVAQEPFDTALAPPNRPLLGTSQRRTLERLRDRLRDEERDGFTHISGSHLDRADYARRVREEIAALDAALAATRVG